MRKDVRALLTRTFEEIACGARTLDPITEIDIVLTEHNFRIMKMNPPRRMPPLVIEEES